MCRLEVAMNERKRSIRMYLVRARQNKGYSMRRTAREAGLAFQHYSKIENGERGDRVSFMVMSRIADALDISLDDMKRQETAYQIENDNEDY